MTWDWPEHFLDRVAQMVLATLYTHHHIDIAIPSVKNVKPSQVTAKVAENINKVRESGDSMVQSYREDNPEIDYLIHKLPANVSKYRGSEAYENCVAAAVVDGVLYLATNFKVRRNPADATSLKPLSRFELSGFNEISGRAKTNILSMLRKEIIGVSINPPLPGEGLANTIRKVAFVSSLVPPANQSLAAGFHAEMQLVSYLLVEKERWLGGVYFGVNKPCCQDCTRQLKKLKIKFSGSHDLRVTNWLVWSGQRTQLSSMHSFYG